MQWNHVNIDDLPKKAQAASARAILGFNEPELPDQSNMPAELAAREWLRVIEPMRKAGVRCGSPGISSAPAGIVWLKDFLGRIRDGGSDVDFYWYVCPRDERTMGLSCHIYSIALLVADRNVFLMS